MSISRKFTSALCAAALLAVAAPAQAQSGYQIDTTGTYVFTKRSVSKAPRHGYSGFYQGPGHLYCSYERQPVRTCGRNGHCRATRWVLKEYCY